MQVTGFDLHPALTQVPAYPAYRSRTHRANHLGLKRNADVFASILQHATTHRPEQDTQLLSVYRLLKKKSCPKSKGLLHSLSFIAAGDDDNWGRFIPGRLADHAGKIET